MVSLLSFDVLEKFNLNKRDLNFVKVKLNCFLDQPIKILGSVKLEVSFVNENINHEFIVVPSEYMSTAFLIGFDLLSKRSFSWEDNTLRWNNQDFKVSKDTLLSISQIKVQENIIDVIVKTKIRLKAKILFWYKVESEGEKFMPDTSYIVNSKFFHKSTMSSLLGKCFVIQTDKEGNLFIPLYSETGTYIGKGTKIATIEVVNEQNVELLDVFGNTIELSSILERCKQIPYLSLCHTHKFLFKDTLSDLGNFSPIQETPIFDCYICNPIPLQVNTLQTPISNDMLPYTDHPSEILQSRKDKLISLFRGLELTHLNNKEIDKLKQVILQNENLFVLDDKDIGLINVPDNHITMLDNIPVRMPLYRHPEKAKEIISKMIQEMLDKDIIEESFAVYLSPIVLISKPDGKKRMCIDYRGVNKHIKIDIHPLPRIDELIEDVAGNRYYCTLDLKDAYYQCQLDEESRDITTFSDGKNLYRFKRLPFGLSVAPAIFTRVMQEVLKPLLRLGWCKNYLDDVIIFAKDFETLITRLDSTFKRMLEMGLKLNVSKCHFAQRKIKFLGHYVSEKGIEVNPENIAAIKRMNPPRSTKEVRQFIGMCSFYRKYIHNFSKIASPLTALQSKKVPFSWNNECQQAFEELKNRLSNTPVLTKVDLAKEFELHTDASPDHVGAVLMQLEKDGYKPLGYFSKKLNKCEKKYSVTDKEALAVVKSCRFFHHYLWGKRFKILTDHQPLTSVFKKRTHSPRMSRYMLEMREYNFDILYRKGKINTVPDALSRPSKPVAKVKLVISNDEALRFPGLTPEIIKKEQRKDSRWTKIINYIEGGSVPKRVPGNRTLDCFELREGILYLKREEFKRLTYCLVIPDSLRAVACNIAHNDTHLGQHKSVRRAQQYFYWPRLWQDIVDFVKSCKTCQQFKREGSLIHHWNELPPVEDKGIRVAIDLIDLVNSSAGFRYCLTVIDHFSRFLRAYPLRNKTSLNVLRALKQDVAIFGIPQVAISDHGSEFTSQEFRKYCKQIGIQQVMCLPYHPRGNSVLERSHRTLKSVLSMLSKEHPNKWPLHLPDAVHILNESVHISLGTSPFFVQFGYHPKRVVGTLLLPEEVETDCNKNLRKLIKENVKSQTTYYRDRANKNRRDNKLKEGELAWIYVEEPIPGTATKLNRKWKGPYKIVKVLGDGRAYELESCFDGTIIQRAAEKLKKYYARSDILDKIDEEWLTEPEQENILPNVRNRKPPERLQY